MCIQEMGVDGTYISKSRPLILDPCQNELQLALSERRLWLLQRR